MGTAPMQDDQILQFHAGRLARHRGDVSRPCHWGPKGGKPLQIAMQAPSPHGRGGAGARAEAGARPATACPPAASHAVRVLGLGTLAGTPLGLIELGILTGLDLRALADLLLPARRLDEI